MENNKYLNKALEDATKIMKVVEAQKKTLDSIVPTIEKELKAQGADMTIIDQMKDAAKNKDLNRLKELSNQIRK